MIGFDLDGVFISDVGMGDREIHDFLAFRNDMYPIFIPFGEYVIVTGRPDSDSALTQDWISRKLYANPPKQFFHDNDDLENSARYKAKIIIEEGLETFVQSDPGQVFMIQSMVGLRCNVIHFGRFISEALSKLH